MLVAAFVPVAWLLGTFPSALLVARAHGRDVLSEGSGNPGASNVARLLGWQVENPNHITLAEVVNHVRPSVLIGAAAQPGAFTQEVR